MINQIVYMAGDWLPMIPLENVSPEKWQNCSQVRTIAAILVIKVVLTSGSISEKPIAGGWSMLSLIGAGMNGLARQLGFDLAP